MCTWSFGHVARGHFVLGHVVYLVLCYLVVWYLVIVYISRGITWPFTWNVCASTAWFATTTAIFFVKGVSDARTFQKATRLTLVLQLVGWSCWWVTGANPCAHEGCNNITSLVLLLLWWGPNNGNDSSCGFPKGSWTCALCCPITSKKTAFKNGHIVCKLSVEGTTNVKSNWCYMKAKGPKSPYADMPGWTLHRNLDDELHQKWYSYQKPNMCCVG